MKKKLVLPLLAVLLVAGGVLGAVLIHQFSGTINVNEAFTSAETDFTMDGTLGDTVTKTVNVQNIASVPLDVRISFVETANVNGVVYVTNSPVTQTLQPGANTIDLTFAINSGSPVGSFSGTISVERV